jgi:hypothetical protein
LVCLKGVLDSCGKSAKSRSKFLLVLASTVLVSGPVGNFDCTFVPTRLLRVLKWGLLFDERRGLTAIGHSPFTGE